MTVSPLVDGVKEYRLRSFEEFPQLIVDQHLDNDTYIYRGQGDSTWLVESTLDRHERAFPNKIIHGGSGGLRTTISPYPPISRKKHLEAFKIACRGVRSGPDDLSTQEWWSIAQHHGLATPLLDWTLSPFAALFFAFESATFERPSKRKGKKPEVYEPEFRAVYCALGHLVQSPELVREKPPKVFVPRRAVTHRLSAQVSVLMEMPAGVDLVSHVRRQFVGESDSNPLSHGRPVITKIEIPSKGRIKCLKMLEKMNINRLSLFGDLDGAAKYINGLWELNFDSPLSWIPDADRKAHRKP